MIYLSLKLLDQALRLTAERLAELEAPQETLVVCGGSALLALGLVDRTTKDVDVLAGVDAVSGLIDPRPLSATLRAVVDEVGIQLDLPPGWLNTGTWSGSMDAPSPAAVIAGLRAIGASWVVVGPRSDGSPPMDVVTRVQTVFGAPKITGDARVWQIG